VELMRERLKELTSADESPAVLAELAALAQEASSAGDVEAAALARSLEAHHARALGKHQHAVVSGAELLHLWPQLKKLPVPDKDELDLRRRIVWGMKYVAGSAMDLPEIPLATTDGVLAVLAEMLQHYDYEPPALWTLEARRAFIAGDEATLRDRIARLTPTVTRYHHVYQCADCPGCVLLQFAEWMGPDASVEEVEEVLAPCLGRRRYLPDPESWQKILDLFYGPSGTCENAERSVPVRLSRAYLRGGNLAQSLQQAERALALAEGIEAERRARALVARTAVATALGKEGERFAVELVERASALEDAYEQLDAFLVAHAALRQPALAERALKLAERLDARINKKRHVAATRQWLQNTTIGPAST
jgi:hypothetical protein